MVGGSGGQGGNGGGNSGIAGKKKNLTPPHHAKRFRCNRKERRSMEAQIREAEGEVVDAQKKLAAATEAMGKALSEAEEVRRGESAGGGG